MSNSNLQTLSNPMKNGIFQLQTLWNLMNKVEFQLETLSNPSQKWDYSNCEPYET